MGGGGERVMSAMGLKFSRVFAANIYGGGILFPWGLRFLPVHYIFHYVEIVVGV